MSNPESLGQVWMIVEVDKEKKPDLFEIVHARSALVLECLRSGKIKSFFEGTSNHEMRLRYGNWENDQLFYI